MQAHTVDRIEERQRDQGEDKNSQVGVNMPQVRDDHTAVVGNGGDLGENLGVSQAVNYCTREQTEQTRDDVIDFSFAGPGDTGAWSGSGERHPDPKDQATQKVADDVGGRNGREDDQPHCP